MQSTLGERRIAGGFIIYGPRNWLIGRAPIARTTNRPEVYTLLNIVRTGQLLVKSVVVIMVLSHGWIVLEW